MQTPISINGRSCCFINRLAMLTHERITTYKGRFGDDPMRKEHDCASSGSTVPAISSFAPLFS